MNSKQVRMFARLALDILVQQKERSRLTRCRSTPLSFIFIRNPGTRTRFRVVPNAVHVSDLICFMTVFNAAICLRNLIGT